MAILLAFSGLHFDKFVIFGIFSANTGNTGTKTDMPKKPQFDYKKTPRGWLLNVPASISQSGNRERLYFTTRDLVKAEARRLS